MEKVTSSWQSAWAVQVRTHPLGCACPACLPLEQRQPDKSTPAPGSTETLAAGHDKLQRVGAVREARHVLSLTAPERRADAGHSSATVATPPPGTYLDVSA